MKNDDEIQCINRYILTLCLDDESLDGNYFLKNSKCFIKKNKFR